MDLIYADFSEAADLAQRLGARAAIAEKTIAAERIRQDVEQAVREEAPEGLTGALRAGIEAQATYLPGGFDIEVTSRAFYTKWVIGGRGWVYPIRAKCLHWVTKSGEDVFAMYARPTEPNPFHERAWAQVKGQVGARFRAYGEEYLALLA